MTKKENITVILGDDVKERIANADFSRFIELLAELIAKERIKEITESEDRGNTPNISTD